MKKFFALLFLLTVVLSGCHGCSFIKQKAVKDQEQTEQDTGQAPEKPQRKVDPIPINPQHS